MANMWIQISGELINLNQITRITKRPMGTQDSCFNGEWCISMDTIECLYASEEEAEKAFQEITSKVMNSS